MVARCGVVLLVGPLVLFVDHDQPKVGLGREDRTPRADHHAVLAAVHLPPLVEALAGRQSAVQHGHVARKSGGEPLDGLVRQGDLWHEDYRPFAELETALDRVEVYLGLAATRHALHQENAAGGRRVQRFSDGRGGVPLGGRELHG